MAFSGLQRKILAKQENLLTPFVDITLILPLEVQLIALNKTNLICEWVSGPEWTLTYTFWKTVFISYLFLHSWRVVEGWEQAGSSSSLLFEVSCFKVQYLLTDGENYTQPNGRVSKPHPSGVHLQNTPGPRAQGILQKREDHKSQRTWEMLWDCVS